MTIQRLIIKGLSACNTPQDLENIVVEIQAKMGLTKADLSHWDKIKDRWQPEGSLESKTTLFAAVISTATRQIVLNLKINDAVNSLPFKKFTESLKRVELKKNGSFDTKNPNLTCVLKNHEYKEGGSNKAEREKEFLSFLNSPIAIWVGEDKEGYLFELEDGNFTAWSSQHSVTSKDIKEAAVPAFFNI